MSEENSKGAGKLDDNQLAAIISAGTILVFMAVYWFLQLQAVRDLLQAAYG